MRLPRSKWAMLCALSFALTVADQWTKYLAVERLTTVFDERGDEGLADRISGFYRYRHLERFAADPYYVYEPLWRMNYVENPGAAWGLFRGLSPGFRNFFFTLVSLGAVAFILRYYRRLREDQRYLQLALTCVLAGAVGNFIDRLARRYVIDFVEWYWWKRPDVRWPTFNVADSLIVIGVAMLMIHPGQKQREAGGSERGEENEKGAA